MNTNEILQAQIVRQIESEIKIEIEFVENVTEPLKLYFQHHIFIKPFFKKAKILNKELAQEILDLIGLKIDQLKNDDFAKTYEITNIKYDEFFNKFYNSL